MEGKEQTQRPYTKEDLIFGVATQPAGEEERQPASGSSAPGEQEGGEEAEEVTKQWKSWERSGGVKGNLAARFETEPTDSNIELQMFI